MSESSLSRRDGVDYVFDTPPEPGQRIRVADGIDWVRQPLPFALDHVNCWVFGAHGGPNDRAGDDVAIIDTGVAQAQGRAFWHEALSGASPSRVLITHFHPDHMGLAGEFADAGAELIGSAIETDLARRIWQTSDEAYGSLYASWYQANAIPESSIERARDFGNGYRKIVAEPPAEDRWSMLGAGDTVTLGARSFRVLIGRGHAPDMLMLYDDSDRILISADQVLPRISPNVSIMPMTADPDPLGSFLETLDELRQLPADTLVLPSHGLPFRGLPERLEALSIHHVERLAALSAAAVEPVTAHDLFPVLFRRELDAQQLSFALGETLAHLVHSGQFEESSVNGVTHWRRI